MNRLNLFMVGAPKCGTTALYEYLRPHPKIFLAEPKEPASLASDMPRLHYLGNCRDYDELFARAGPRHAVVGEGSTCYLYSETALDRIRELNASAKILVMLRNPVEAVVAFHSQMCYDLDEDQRDFETAWRLQEERREGRSMPASCRAAVRLQYRQVFLLGQHVEKVLRLFSREQVKLVLYDDFAADTRAVYQDVLRFLGVEDDGRTDFPRINASKVNRSRWLAAMTLQTPRSIMRPVAAVKEKLGIKSLGIGRALIWLNRREARRKPLPPELRRELIEAFRDDVELLSRIMNRDLSHWLKQ